MKLADYLKPGCGFHGAVLIDQLPDDAIEIIVREAGGREASITMTRSAFLQLILDALSTGRRWHAA